MSIDVSAHSFHKRYSPTKGYTRLIERGEMGITTLEFGIVNLSKNESFFEDTARNEVILIVLGGRCTLLVGHNGNKAYDIIGEREDVFGGDAYRAYIPCRTTYEIIADKTPVEVATCKAPSYLETSAIIAGPGDGITETDLGTAMTVSEAPVPHISGEAICFYRFQQPDSSVHLHLTKSDSSFNQTISVQHNDVLALPIGYHTELVESGNSLYCLSVTGNSPINVR